MAPLAIHREIHILSVGMALLAIESGMNTDQRESGALVTGQHLFLVTPLRRGMTFLTSILRKLSPVHIKMAIFASRLCFSKNQISVTRKASDRRVSPQ